MSSIEFTLVQWAHDTVPLSCSVERSRTQFSPLEVCGLIRKSGHARVEKRKRKKQLKESGSLGQHILILNVLLSVELKASSRIFEDFCGISCLTELKKFETLQSYWSPGPFSETHHRKDDLKEPRSVFSMGTDYTVLTKYEKHALWNSVVSSEW